MKTTQFFWLAPVAGLLVLTACNTTSDHSTPPPAPPHTESAPATAAQGGSYLVGLTKQAPPMVAMGDTFTYDIVVTAQQDVADVLVADTVPSGASYVGSEPAAAHEGDRLTWKLG